MKKIISSKEKDFTVISTEAHWQPHGEQGVFYAQREWNLVIRQIPPIKPKLFYSRENTSQERDWVMILSKKI